MQRNFETPSKQGLYCPQTEKDNCGVGFVAHIKGQKSHSIVENGIQILANLHHRGAVGADPNTGDGAGILIQIPHAFFKKELANQDIALPAAGQYGVGMVFLPQEPNARYFCEGICERILTQSGIDLIGWRVVPQNRDACGLTAVGTMPNSHQFFVVNPGLDPKLFERKLYIVRKQIERAVESSNQPYTEAFYICSLSSTTIIYKGQLLAFQIPDFYPDLKNSLVISAIALVHQRYSTNTFPSWDRAQPFRYLAHNGEINTLRGNINWMKAREGILACDAFGEELDKLFPIIEQSGSDSANLDNVLELLLASGKSLTEAISILVPQAWQDDATMAPPLKSYYEYHARLMEPWDGPAAIAFTDGIQIGATLDRNGLRPARYLITDDDFVILASETGVLPDHSAVQRGRLEPGKIFLIDTAQGRIIPDSEIKKSLYHDQRYLQWVSKHRITLDQLPVPHQIQHLGQQRTLEYQKIFGYTEEELKKTLAPMAFTGKEPIVSMGNDAALAVLSDRSVLLYDYFKQLFAQVTNPPIDPIREKLVMSNLQFLGNRGNFLADFDSADPNHYIRLEQPILDNEAFEKIVHISNKDFRPIKIPAVYNVIEQEAGLNNALNALTTHVEEAIHEGYNIIIISDRGANKYVAPIPSLLAAAAVHHHLIRQKSRTKVDLLVETGDARTVMHMALLLGYGVDAINPYLAFESIHTLVEQQLYLNDATIDYPTAQANYINALHNGLLKIYSKMGICTLQSYHGAQIFEAIGIKRSTIDLYFTGTISRIEGIGLAEIAEEIRLRHNLAFNSLRNPYPQLPSGSHHQWRKNGENHLFNPDTIHLLQHSCRTNDYALFKKYSSLIDQQATKLNTIRGLLRFKSGAAIPLAEVESVESIVKRFATGAMSFGSLSAEAHQTLAQAMNAIGGKSNSGEGGEAAERYYNPATRSLIKQVASGRFGVNTDYLVNCTELQIKMAQGAKPGEGGHLPGHKVSPEIAKVRNSTPGISLISPPPHHDIYSIEDLAQLIYDLKNVNPQARINVKLVSQVGVGTVATGVAKAHADVVLISGHDGGSGAAPLSSIKHTGVPWELGLSETQQTLLLNNLRSRIVVQTDGQLKTGRDVAIATLLGAEEYGFATAPLVVSGCIMMRKCQNNTCPVGVATQDPELRRNFKGDPQHVINFFTFIATELREIMAQLGFRTINEMVGRVDKLEPNPDILGWKSQNIDFDAILYRPELPSRIKPLHTENQPHNLTTVLDRQLIADAQPAINRLQSVRREYLIRNTNRSTGAMLAGHIATITKGKPLPADLIHYKFIGSAGQSFGAFSVTGTTLELEGDSNDYLGKGLSGGKIILYPSKNASLAAEANIIAGNTLLYGATDGEIYINGHVGERFAVRNSGAIAVVEGVGDHGCEYMTGGIAVILGQTGRNFGAGMSGGVAYVYDPTGVFSKQHCNYQIVKAEPLGSQDKAMVKNLIENHHRYTGSLKAAHLLQQFDIEIQYFVKIISPEYQQILENTPNHPMTIFEKEVSHG